MNSLQLFSFSFVFYTKTREIDSDPVSISETEICSNFGGKNIAIFILSFQHDEPFREINSDPVSIAILRFDRIFGGKISNFSPVVSKMMKNSWKKVASASNYRI